MQTFQWTCANCGRKALPTQPVFEYGQLLVCAHCYRALMPAYRRIVFDLVALSRSRKYRIVAAIAVSIGALTGLDLALTQRQTKAELPRAGTAPAASDPTEKPVADLAATMSDEDKNALELAFLDNGEQLTGLRREKVDAYRPLLRSLAARYSLDVNDIGTGTATLPELTPGLINYGVATAYAEYLRTQVLQGKTIRDAIANMLKGFQADEYKAGKMAGRKPPPASGQPSTQAT